MKFFLSLLGMLAIATSAMAQQPNITPEMLEQIQRSQQQAMEQYKNVMTPEMQQYMQQQLEMRDQYFKSQGVTTPTAPTGNTGQMDMRAIENMAKGDANIMGQMQGIPGLAANTEPQNYFAEIMGMIHAGAKHCGQKEADQAKFLFDGYVTRITELMPFYTSDALAQSFDKGKKWVEGQAKMQACNDEQRNFTGPALTKTAQSLDQFYQIVAEVLDRDLTFLTAYPGASAAFSLGRSKQIMKICDDKKMTEMADEKIMLLRNQPAITGNLMKAKRVETSYALGQLMTDHQSALFEKSLEKLCLSVPKAQEERNINGFQGIIEKITPQL